MKIDFGEYNGMTMGRLVLREPRYVARILKQQTHMKMD